MAKMILTQYLVRKRNELFIKTKQELCNRASKPALGVPHCACSVTKCNTLSAFYGLLRLKGDQRTFCIAKGYSFRKMRFCRDRAFLYLFPLFFMSLTPRYAQNLSSHNHVLSPIPFYPHLSPPTFNRLLFSNNCLVLTVKSAISCSACFLLPYTAIS